MGGVEGIMMAKRIRPSRDEHAIWCAALVAIVEKIQPATKRRLISLMRPPGASRLVWREVAT